MSGRTDNLNLRYSSRNKAYRAIRPSRRRSPNHRTVSKGIQATVIVPTAGNRAHLARTLVSLAAQRCVPDAYEIIVVRNGDRDDKESATVGAIASRSPARIRYVVEQERGLLAGRHRGVSEARGDLLIFVDDDVQVDGAWLPAILDTFDAGEVELVGGPCLPRYESTPPAWLNTFWRQAKDGRRWCGPLSLLDFGKTRSEIDPVFIWGLNFAIRKSTLIALGGFHPDGIPWELRRYRGDGETAVGVAARKAGLKAIYEPRALVYHRIASARLTIEYFEKRRYLQGISDSYTQIRQMGGLDREVSANEEKKRFDWKEPLRRVKRLLTNPTIKSNLSKRPKPFADIKKGVKAAYLAGYEYHQNEVRSDPRLLEWALRPDYWDYRLPEPETGG